MNGIVFVITFAICIFLSLVMMILLAKFAEGRKLRLKGKGISFAFFPGEGFSSLIIACSMGFYAHYEQVVIMPVFIVIAAIISVGFLFVRIFAPSTFPLADWKNYSDKRMLFSPTKIYHDVVCLTGMLFWAICVGLSVFFMMPWDFGGIAARVCILLCLIFCALCIIEDAKHNPDTFVLHSPTWLEDSKARRR